MKGDIETAEASFSIFGLMRDTDSLNGIHILLAKRIKEIVASMNKSARYNVEMALHPIQHEIYRKYGAIGYVADVRIVITGNFARLRVKDTLMKLQTEFDLFEKVETEKVKVKK